MKPFWILSAVASLVLAVPQFATAGLIVVPSATNIGVGDTVSVTVRIDELEDAVAPSLGAFQLDFLYDNTILQLVDVSFGTQLALNGMPSLSGFIPGVGSGVTVFEVSLNSTAELDTQQAGSFDLFHITFEALANGTSLLALTNIILSDAASPPNDITATMDVTGAALTVGSEITPIPEPGTMLLVLSGLAMRHGLRRRRSRSDATCRGSQRAGATVTGDVLPK